MEAPQRHYSTGQIRPHRFELHYEQQYMPNRPVRARLLQYCEGPCGSQFKRFCDINASRFNEVAVDEKDSDVRAIDKPSLLRSFSLPHIPLKEKIFEMEEQRHSRKNSLVSNCCHSRESSVSDEDMCSRHHHRRGSVAIKFGEKKVVE
jgi:hypothetical protein